MTSKKTLLAGGLGLLLAGFAVAFPMFEELDYSQLPPNPSEVAAKLETAKVDLAQAVKTAQEKANGRAKSASYKFDATPPAIEVMVFSAEGGTRVHVDVMSGEVIKADALPDFDLPGAAVDGTPMSTDSGLMYYDIVVGDGTQPTPTSRVMVHYSGWLVDGTKFDSSVDRGEPIDFPLNGVIAGWTEGVGSMKVGGKRKLLIPYQLAYGERGRPGAIPPKAMLVFDVELLDILENEPMTTIDPEILDNLAGDPVTGPPTTTPSGLVFYDLNAGDGPSPGRTDTVRVHYTGWLLDGRKFDSSVDRGAPAVFPLDRVIPGWTEGVGGMQVGGKRKLVIPFALGYGDRGMPPHIPPRATLVFDVELLAIEG